MVIAYIGCDRITVTVLLCLSIVSQYIFCVSFGINHNDLAPNYSVILMGIANIPGTLSAMVLPPLIGYIVGDEVKIFFIITEIKN